MKPKPTATPAVIRVAASRASFPVVSNRDFIRSWVVRRATTKTSAAPVLAPGGALIVRAAL